MKNLDSATERFFVIVKNKDTDEYPYVKSPKASTNSIKYAKKFNYKFEAQEFIQSNNLTGVKVAQATINLSYVSYEGKDRPLTQKQKDFIRKLVDRYGEFLGIEYPKNVATVEEASNWIKQTLENIEEIRFYDELESYGLPNQ